MSNSIIRKVIRGYHQALTRCMRACQFLLGASTVGVRTLVVDHRQRILLVKHTYMPDWHFPGGGVSRGEPAKIAAIRELREEAAVVSSGEVELYGLYFHKVMGVNDYVALYVVKQFHQTAAKISPEIAEVQWFDLNKLPADLSASTRKRLDEYFLHHPKIDQW